MYNLSNFILFAFNLIFAINVCFCRDARVLNGNVAQLGLFASHVQLRLRAGNQHLCGGTLIEAQTVLTAASCVIGRKYKDLLVMAGDVSLYETTAHQHISQVFAYYVHPLYDTKKDQFSYNLAVVKTVSPYPKNAEISPVRLLEMTIAENKDHCYIPGWGITGIQGFPTHNLFYAELFVVDVIACGHCSPKTICAMGPKFGDTNKTGPCHMLYAATVDPDLSPAKLIVPEETESRCFMAGWGSVENDTRRIPTNLFYIEMLVASATECGRCAVKTLCAVSKENITGLCKGDEGGGLYCNGYLRGIYAGSIAECAGNGATFGDIVQLSPWITKMINFQGGSDIPAARSIRRTKRGASAKHCASNVILSIMLIILLFFRVN